MTVKELISKLSELPQDASVYGYEEIIPGYQKSGIVVRSIHYHPEYDPQESWWIETGSA